MINAAVLHLLVDQATKLQLSDVVQICPVSSTRAMLKIQKPCDSQRYSARFANHVVVTGDKLSMITTPPPRASFRFDQLVGQPRDDFPFNEALKKPLLKIKTLRLAPRTESTLKTMSCMQLDYDLEETFNDIEEFIQSEVGFQPQLGAHITDQEMRDLSAMLLARREEGNEIPRWILPGMLVFLFFFCNCTLKCFPGTKRAIQLL